MTKEVYPFTTITWNTRKLERLWEPVRQECLRATHITEYEMVKRGLRRCDVYQLDPPNFDEQIKKVVLDGLYYLPILRSQIYHGFGHRHYVTNTLDQNSFVYGCACGSLEDAILFHDAGVIDLKRRIGEYEDDEMNPEGIDHKITGELLGYPECCSDWFLDVWLSKGCVDPMYETAENTPNSEMNEDGSVRAYGNPMFNRLIRYFGFQVIPYFTHSYDCEPSKEFAEKWWGIMHEYAPEASEQLLEILNMPMTWTLKNLIIYVEHPYFRAAANGYDFPEVRKVYWDPTLE